MVAISGLAAAGKGTIAREFARVSGFKYYDLGLLFRFVAYLLKEGSIKDLSNLKTRKEFKYIWDGKRTVIMFDGKDITKKLTTPEIAEMTAEISRDEENLKALSRFVENIIPLDENIVCDGRNAGTTIFPNADFKFYVFALLETRAKRRRKDNRKLGFMMSYRDVLKLINLRDKMDLERSFGKAEKPVDAYEINTNILSAKEATDFICDFIKNK